MPVELDVTVSRLASSRGAGLARSVVGAAKTAVAPVRATKRLLKEIMVKRGFQ